MAISPEIKVRGVDLAKWTIDKYGTKWFVACFALYILYRLTLDQTIVNERLLIAGPCITAVTLAYFFIREIQERRRESAKSTPGVGPGGGTAAEPTITSTTEGTS